jgi:hypothetical protein
LDDCLVLLDRMASSQGDFGGVQINGDRLGESVFDTWPSLSSRDWPGIENCDASHRFGQALAARHIG